MKILETEIIGNSLTTWAIAFGVAIAFLLVVSILRWVLSRQFKRIADASESLVWDALNAVVRQSQSLFLIIVAVFLGSIALDLPDKAQNLITLAAIVALLIQSGRWASTALRVVLGEYREQKQDEDPASITTLSVIAFVGRVIIWSLVLLLLLDNLGVDVTALIAGLGVGGIAVALAVQTILGDLFASLSIVLDKPFVVGDFLAVGDLLGSVEYVGLKTTRLRSLSGEQLVFSNSDLLNSRIRNFGRMSERRVAFDIGVTYQTPHDKLILIPQILREAIEAEQNTRFDRSHFKKYGDFALIFETVYYVASPDYNLFMDIQQAINLDIYARFEQEGIVFAYPTQTLFIEKSAG
jgi:small-conductance mechanosensitive channel